MGNTFLLFIIIILLINLHSKLDNLENSDEMTPSYTKKIKKSLKRNEVEKLIGKNVMINIDQDNISEEFLFSPLSKTSGIIKDVGDTWLTFEYETKKEVITRYFRLSDIISIDEVK